MKRLLFFLLTITPIMLHAQKVGLVMSGGAAKGLAHVGVLKALEENDIPIDYVVGTSMGGIIAGCYAAGMSPNEIENIVLSGEFLGWVNGDSEKGFNYFYHKPDPNPGFLTLNLALDTTLSLQFNTNFARDVSLNFALAEKMAQASAISNGVFDSLFVPLRVVAADIFTQNEVVLSKGSLSDALRATQTVPFFYQPIRVDGKYLFDGGVYNNFPVDVAQRDFNPDVMIGVNVSTKIFDEYPYDSDDKLISRSLLYMLLDKSDPSMIPENGIFIQPNLVGYTSFDFDRAKAFIDSGYAQTMRQMDEIKEKIKARKSCEEVAIERNKFNGKNFPMVFGKLSFQGFNSKQRGYLRRIFRTNRKYKGYLYYSDIKKGYFRLVSEEFFNNVYPRILFDSANRVFTLQLARRPQKDFQVDFGGVIATRDISSIFLGLNYYYFKRTLMHANLSFQAGNFFKSAMGRVRIDLPESFFIEPYGAVEGWNYLQNDDLLKNVSSSITPTVLKRFNPRIGVNAGFPLKHSFKVVFNFEGFDNVDTYSNDSIFNSTERLDELSIAGYRSGIQILSNTLNRKQYASQGKMFNLQFNYFSVRELLKPGTTSVTATTARDHHRWWRVKATAEHYIGNGIIKPGYIVEAVLSDQPTFSNYFGTLINTPGFQPLQDSRTLILQNFRSFNYVAGGIRNVISVHPKIDVRLEAYAFKPFEYLYKGPEKVALVKNDFNKVFYAGTAAVVYHSPIGPLSLSANYYDNEQNELGVLLHLGFLLFNKHSLE